jgi:hypothetical protein
LTKYMKHWLSRYWTPDNAGLWSWEVGNKWGESFDFSQLTVLREFSDYDIGRTQSLLSFPSWDRAKSLSKPWWLEFLEYLIELHRESSSETYTRSLPNIQQRTDEHGIPVRKLLQAKERTNWKDSKAQGLALMQPGLPLR